jgi:hypothetical protein
MFVSRYSIPRAVHYGLSGGAAGGALLDGTEIRLANDDILYRKGGIALARIPS